MTKVVGVIPARFASTRFPVKMLADLAGKALVVRTWENACRTKTLDEVLVATDDDRIADVITQAGGKAVMTSPDLPSGSDRVLAALEGIPADIIANIQGDEPLLPPGTIDNAVRLLFDNQHFQVTTAAVPLEPDRLQDPNAVKVVVDKTGRALYFSRSMIPFAREGNPPLHLYRRHIGLYVYRRDALASFCSWPQSELEQCEKLEQLRLLEHGVSIGVLDIPEAPPGVDTVEDLEQVKAIFARQA